ncbi:MAG: globin [Ilumatobacteraceae bacterium]
MGQEQMLYERVGGAISGADFFTRLVDHFYAGVVNDDVLWPLYPDQSDLAGAKERLTLFLIQYWGGPQTYMERRGHPRLRLRHLPFHIGPQERDRWLVHMAAAVEAVTDDLDLRAELMAYFVPAAEHLRNDTGLPISTRRPE